MIEEINLYPNDIRNWSISIYYLNQSLWLQLEVWDGCGSNQVPTYLSQLLQLYSPWWSSVAIVTSNHCISGFCPMTQHPVQPNKGLSPRTAVVETGLREGKAMQRNLTKMVFSNGPTPASFCLSFVFSNKQYNSYNKSKWKNVHPVYGAGIQTHNISNMSCHQ